MRPEDRDPGLLWDLLEQARGIAGAIQGLSQQDFLRSVIAKLIVERRLEIKGEIAKRVSGEMKERLVGIPLAGIVGQRNVLAHEYDAAIIDHNRISRTISLSIPRMAGINEEFLASHPPDSGPNL